MDAFPTDENWVCTRALSGRDVARFPQYLTGIFTSRGPFPKAQWFDARLGRILTKEDSMAIFFKEGPDPERKLKPRKPAPEQEPLPPPPARDEPAPYPYPPSGPDLD